MTGFCQRLELPIKVVRTAIELAALGVGWMLGGTVGFGTVLYAIAIGWIVHHALPIFTIDKARGSAPAVPSSLLRHRPTGSLKSTTSPKSPTPAYRPRRSTLRRQAPTGAARTREKLAIFGCFT